MPVPQPPKKCRADDSVTTPKCTSGFRVELLKDTESLEGVRVPQPCIFIQGSNDVVAKMIPNGHLDALCEDLRGEFSETHWLPVEAKDNVNRISLDFLAEFV